MKNKHCNWCDNQFSTSISYQIYCSAECREQATKEKIAQKYLSNKIQNRRVKMRVCKLCGINLSIYNDNPICQSCEINPNDVKDALKEIKGIIDGKIELE
jgi:hypothetical protein